MYGLPYDEWLFNYINGTKYPSQSQWKEMEKLVKEVFCFTRSKVKNKIPCVLFRGTDYPPLLSVDVGDELDFTQRFYSWTDKYKVALDVIGVSGTILILETTNVYGIDLRKINQVQGEILLPPDKFIVVKVQVAENVRNVFLKPINEMVKVEMKLDHTP